MKKTYTEPKFYTESFEKENVLTVSGSEQGKSIAQDDLGSYAVVTVDASSVSFTF